jgi:hypothetical protein
MEVDPVLTCPYPPTDRPQYSVITIWPQLVRFAMVVDRQIRASAIWQASQSLARQMVRCCSDLPPKPC